MRKPTPIVLSLALVTFLAGCSGGSNSADPVGTAPPPTTGSGDPGCTGSCVPLTGGRTAPGTRRAAGQPPQM